MPATPTGTITIGMPFVDVVMTAKASVSSAGIARLSLKVPMRTCLARTIVADSPQASSTNSSRIPVLPVAI